MASAIERIDYRRTCMMLCTWIRITSPRRTDDEGDYARNRDGTEVSLNRNGFAVYDRYVRAPEHPGAMSPCEEE